MPTLTPDEDLVTHIESEVAELVDGKNLYAAPVRAYNRSGVPHKCVFVTASGGDPSRPFKQTGLEERRPTLNIRIRGDKDTVSNAFRVGQTLARAVFDAVHLNPPTSFCEVMSASSQPIYIGMDEDGHHEWSINLSTIMDYVS